MRDINEMEHALTAFAHASYAALARERANMASQLPGCHGGQGRTGLIARAIRSAADKVAGASWEACAVPAGCRGSYPDTCV